MAFITAKNDWFVSLSAPNVPPSQRVPNGARKHSWQIPKPRSLRRLEMAMRAARLEYSGQSVER